MTLLRSLILAIFAAVCLMADFSYEQNSKITGGMLAGMMKFAGAFSKQAREPLQSTVVVKGDRMAHINPSHASIIDLGKETITHIDFQKKSYSVMTFAEMQQALERATQKMKDQKQGQMDFKVSATPTGQTKQINGFDTKEIILKIVMEGTDQKSGQKGAMTMTTDMWMAPKVPGYDEITSFYKRMGAKLNWAPGANPMLNRPDMAKGFGEMYKQIASMDGMPIYEVVKMGAEGQVPAGSEGTPSQQQAPPREQQQAEKPSAGGALGSALGGRLGRFGGLGRKKKDEAQTEQAAPNAPAQQQAGGDTSGALMEMTIEMSNFSTAPVDASKFEIPSGFKQVQPEMPRGQ